MDSDLIFFTLAILTWLSALVMSIALFAGSMRQFDLESPTGRAARCVCFVDRWVLHPIIAVVGVSTSHWTVRRKAGACRVMGLIALALTLLLGELGLRSR